jgi:hypothetical protein
VIGCVEGESWSYVIADEATIHDVRYGGDLSDLERRVRDHYGYSPCGRLPAAAVAAP